MKTAIHFAFLSVIGAFSTFFSGCAALTPYIQDFNIVSVQQEKELSEQLAQSISQNMTLVSGTAEARAVKSTGERLVSAIPNPAFDYEFYLVQDKTPNAFTIPGGKIYVHTGLMQMATPNELAGVLAHEIGHAHERHPAKSLSRAYGIAFLTQLLLDKNAQQSQFRQIALQLAQGTFLTKYSRDDEREADQISFFLLKRAEIPPDGLLSFLSKLQKLEAQAGTQPPTFLRTHPATQERIELLRSLIEQNQTVDPFRAG